MTTRTALIVPFLLALAAGSTRAQMTDEDRKAIVDLVEKFRASVVEKDWDGLRSTFGPSLPEARRQEIVDNVSKAVEGWNMTYRIDVSADKIQPAGEGKASLSTTHSMEGTKNGSNWNMNGLGCEFAFEKVQPQAEGGAGEWKIASTTADGTFKLKEQAGTLGLACIGACAAFGLLGAGGIALIIWLVVRKKRAAPAA